MTAKPSREPHPNAERALSIVRAASEEEMRAALRRVEHLLDWDDHLGVMPQTWMARELGISFYRLRYLIMRHWNREEDRRTRRATNLAQSTSGRVVTESQMGFSLWVPDSWVCADYFEDAPHSGPSPAQDAQMKSCWRVGPKLPNDDQVDDLEVMTFDIRNVTSAVDLLGLLRPDERNLTYFSRPTGKLKMDGLDTAYFYCAWGATDPLEQASWFAIDGSTGWELSFWSNQSNARTQRPLYKRVVASFKRI